MSRRFYCSPGTVEMIRYGADILDRNGDLVEIGEGEHVPTFEVPSMETGRIAERTDAGGFRMLTVKINRPIRRPSK